MTEIPSDLYYTKTHEWVRVEGDIAVVGITDYAVEQMNREIINVELPEKGRKVMQEDSVGVIDSVKAAFDLYSPLSGEVTAVNELLVEKPELVGQSPYGEGWFFELKVGNASELTNLLKAEDYERMIQKGEQGS